MSANASAYDLISRELTAREPDVPTMLLDLSRTLCLSEAAARAVVRSVVARSHAALFPPIAEIELIHTEGCNLACTYCFEREMLGHRRMTPEVAKAAINFLMLYSRDAEEVKVTHFGGEPTLNFKAVCAATEYAEECAAAAGKNVTFSMTTNGTLFTEGMVDYFALKNIRVLLSIDGLAQRNDRYRVDKKGNGTFDRAIRGLELLKSRQPWIGVKMTIMPENADSLYEDVIGLRVLGVNQFVIGHATGVKWSDEEMRAYGRELKRVFDWYTANKGPSLRIAEFDDGPILAGTFGCQAGRSSVAISVNGEISACSKILGLNSKNLLAKLGDVDLGLTHFVNRGDMVSCSSVRSACDSKGIAEHYAGGCFASNFSDNGDLFEPSLQDHEFSLMNRSICAGCTASR